MRTWMGKRIENVAFLFLFVLDTFFALRSLFYRWQFGVRSTFCKVEGNRLASESFPESKQFRCILDNKMGHIRNDDGSSSLFGCTTWRRALWCDACTILTHFKEWICSCVKCVCLPSQRTHCIHSHVIIVQSQALHILLFRLYLFCIRCTVWHEINVITMSGCVLDFVINFRCQSSVKTCRLYFHQFFLFSAWNSINIIAFYCCGSRCWNSELHQVDNISILTHIHVLITWHFGTVHTWSEVM